MMSTTSRNSGSSLSAKGRQAMHSPARTISQLLSFIASYPIQISPAKGAASPLPLRTFFLEGLVTRPADRRQHQDGQEQRGSDQQTQTDRPFHKGHRITT